MAIDLEKPDDEEIEDGNANSGQPESVDEQEGGADEKDELDEEGALPEEIDAQPEKPSRGETRFQKLANEAKEARELAARLERDIQELKNRPQPQPEPVKEREPTAEEMALWSPDQIVDYRLSKVTKTYDQRLQQIQFQTYEATDKAAFQALAASDPRAKQMADEVETELQRQRGLGQNIAREVLYTYMLGKRIRDAKPAVEKARADGQRRIQKQRASGGSPKSDQPNQRGKLSEAEARAKRLENVTF
jgi:hypothetical protein